MFRRWAAACAVVALCVSASAAFAADGGFEASFTINRQQATIGDEIIVHVEIVHDDLFVVNDLPQDLQVPPFIVKRVERAAPKKIKGVTADAFKIVLTVFDTGRYEVPPIPIRFMDPKGKAGVVYTEKWPVEVFSVLGDAKDKDAKDIRPLKSPASLETEAQRRRRWMIWALAVLIGLGTGIGIWLGWKKFEAWREARKPAHQRALEALDRLDKKALIAAGQPKGHYAELTDILKTYLIRRYGKGSMDETTREFVAALERDAAAAVAADDAKAVLAAADLVKFARDLPTAETARGTMTLVRRLVEHTTPVPKGMASS